MEGSEVFAEWDAYAKKKQLRERELDFKSMVKAAELKISVLSGIRRSGKSSALMLLAQKLEKDGKRAAYINLEDSRMKGKPEILDDALKWFGEDGYLLLDEITSANDWDGWLSRNHELLKGKLRMIITSSRRGLLFPEKALRRRMLVFGMYPLRFDEFLTFSGIVKEDGTVGKGKLEHALWEYLKYGGFPEIALTLEDADKVRVLGAYFRDIVGLDVAEASGEEVSLVETFARYVVQTPFFSASKCLNFLKSTGYKIGKEKILELENCAQMSYLFFFVPVFSYNIKDRSQYPRKAYCGDTGFLYAIGGKIDYGRAYENAAFLELKRRNWEKNEIAYWKNKEGLEVDFIVRNGKVVLEAIQVVYEMKEEGTREREMRALVKCAKELRPAKAVILTKNEKRVETVEGVKIRFVPLLEWLLEQAPKT